MLDRKTNSSPVPKIMTRGIQEVVINSVNSDINLNELKGNRMHVKKYLIKSTLIRVP
jgi:hypothetical protein